VRWKLLVSLGLAVLVTLSALVAVQARVPQLPHLFFGTITVASNPAPVGTVITAKVGGVERGSITTTQVGLYGGPDALDPKLVVQGEDIAAGSTVQFFVDGVQANQTFPFDSGAVTQLNLTAAAAPPPPVPKILRSITITPSEVTVVVGGQVQFSATGLDQNGVPFSGVAFTWSVLDPIVGSIDSSTGLLTVGNTPGVFTNAIRVQGTKAGITVTATVSKITIAQAGGTLVSVRITPDPATVIVETTLQFNATGLDEDAVPVSDVVFTWTVLDPTVGSIDSSTGLFTAGTSSGVFRDPVQVQGAKGEIVVSATVSEIRIIVLPAATELVQPDVETTITSLEEDIAVTVPAGAISVPIHIGVINVVVEPDEAPPAGFRFSERVFAINVFDSEGNPVSEFRFDAQVTICVQVTDGEIAELGGDISKIVIQRFIDPPGEWIDLPTNFEPGVNKACTTITKASFFTLVLQGVSVAPKPIEVALPAPTPTPTLVPELTPTPLPPEVGDFSPGPGLIIGLIVVGLPLRPLVRPCLSGRPLWPGRPL